MGATIIVFAVNGSVQIVVAHHDPGATYPNWLSTAGHDQGSMLFRCIEAEASLLSKPESSSLENYRW